MENKFFNKAKAKAEEIAKDNNRLKRLMGASGDKLKDLDLENIKNSKLLDRLKVLLRMLKAYANGTYRDIQWKSLLIMIAGLVYFVMPIDLIPDFIPITGFVDDFGVILWVFSAIQREIDNFGIWERGLKPANGQALTDEKKDNGDV